MNQRSHRNQRVVEMMEGNASKVDVDVHTESDRETSTLTQFRDLVSRLKQPVSNSFRDVFLSADNVYDVVKGKQAGSRTREKGRRRVTVNEAYHHGDVSDALRWHEERAKQFGDHDHIEPFKERADYHTFVSDALEDVGKAYDDVVPFRP